MNYEECFEKGQLRKATIGKEDAGSQLKIAKDYLEKARIILEKNRMSDVSFLMSYNSMFHSARALLYSKGYKERSHYCMYEFLRHEFRGDAEIRRLVEVCQNYREARAHVQYEGSFCSEHTAKEALLDAAGFLKLAKEKLRQ